MQEGPDYIRVFVNILRNINKEDTVEYVLALIDEMLTGIWKIRKLWNFISVFFSISQQDYWFFDSKPQTSQIISWKISCKWRHLWAFLKLSFFWNQDIIVGHIYAIFFSIVLMFLRCRFLNVSQIVESFLFGRIFNKSYSSSDYFGAIIGSCKKRAVKYCLLQWGI